MIDEKEFTRFFLTNLLTIVNNQDQLKKARQVFQHGSSNDPRYNCQQSMGLVGWSTDEALNFSAAIFEALARTLQQYVNNPDVKTEDFYKHEKTIKSKIIPELVAKINPTQAFTELPSHLTREIRKLTPVTTSTNDNSFFWTGAAIAVSVVAAVSGVAIASKLSQ